MYRRESNRPTQIIIYLKTVYQIIPIRSYTTISESRTGFCPQSMRHERNRPDHEKIAYSFSNQKERKKADG